MPVPKYKIVHGPTPSHQTLLPAMSIKPHILGNCKNIFIPTVRAVNLLEKTWLLHSKNRYLKGFAGTVWSLQTLHLGPRACLGKPNISSCFTTFHICFSNPFLYLPCLFVDIQLPKVNSLWYMTHPWWFFLSEAEKDFQVSGLKVKYHLNLASVCPEGQISKGAYTT